MTDKGFTTRLVHADRLINQPANGAIHSPTSNSVLFEYKDVNDLVEVFQGKQAGHVYSRSSSPSNDALQNMLANVESGVSALTFATGMGAISAVLLALLQQGDHILVSRYLFGNTRSLMSTLQHMGIEISYVDVTDVEQVIDEVKMNTRMLFTETIANPVTQVADLSALGKLCEEHGLVYVVDNTMTPGYIFDAKRAKVSLLVSSLTKYFAGHGSVLGGVVIDMGKFDWKPYPHIAKVYQTGDSINWGMTQIKKRGLRDIGGTLSPQSASSIALGMETLALRLDRSFENALRLATFLHTHDQVEKVYYPGLSDHPQHFIAREHFAGHYGAIFSLELSSNVNLFEFINNLNIVICATHLGDTRTLCLPVAHTIYHENTHQEREQMGISDNLVRFSVGIEDINDLVSDFEQAFSKSSKVPTE